MGVEIERKWLPDKEWVSKVTAKASPEEITQGYLCRKPVIRIRKEGESYILTYKGKGLLQHEEYNLPLGKEAFEELLPKCSGKVIKKSRYRLPVKDCFPKETEGDNDLIMEIDVFREPDPGLVILEVEFPNREAAEVFQAPEAFGTDVTENPRYYNAVISG